MQRLILKHANRRRVATALPRRFGGSTRSHSTAAFLRTSAPLREIASNGKRTQIGGRPYIPSSKALPDTAPGFDPAVDEYPLVVDYDYVKGAFDPDSGAMDRAKAIKQISKEMRAVLDARLHVHGAVLFRTKGREEGSVGDVNLAEGDINLIQDPADFNRMTDALGYNKMDSYAGGA